MKKSLGFITMIMVVATVCTMSIPVYAMEKDAELLTVEFQPDPYGDGVSILEWKILEKMEAAAKELGIDISTDEDFLRIFRIKYNTLKRVKRDAYQVDFALDLIDRAKKMIQDGIDKKNQENEEKEQLPEDVIKEGAFAGFTEKEKEDLLSSVFNSYIQKELSNVAIVDRDLFFGAQDAVAWISPYTDFVLLNGEVSGDNYIVRDFETDTTDYRKQVSDYFEGEDYLVFRFKTYPEEGKLKDNSNIQIRVTNYVFRYQGVSYHEDIVVCHIAENGVVEETSSEITSDGAIIFQTSKLGYYAVGIRADIQPTPTKQTVITETPNEVPIEPVATVTPGKKTAPKTADESKRAAVIIIMIMSASVLTGLITVKGKSKIN